MDLSAADRAMVRLYMAACFHYWDQLPELAREYVAHGASVEQLRGCVRHLVVFAGYGPCLAATLTLHKSKLLPEDTPGKVGGPPGNAFELVYGGVTDRVRANMQAADPVLQEWIRQHLYGDVYSSPGLGLRQKQLLTCAFLAEAAMPDQLFGHALAGLRFGNSRAALEEAARLAVSMGPRRSEGRQAVLQSALRTLDLAAAKFGKDTAGGEAPPCPEVCIPDPSSRCIPPLPPPVNVAPGEAPPLPAAALPAAPQGAGAQAAAAEKAEELVEAEEAEADAAAGGGDAVVTVGSGEGGLKLEEGCALGGGWGTSNIGRPTSLSVDLVAARMEEHRARSGLFVAWDALPEEEDGYGEALPPGLPVPSGYEPDSLQDEAVPADGDADAAEEVQRW